MRGSSGPEGRLGAQRVAGRTKHAATWPTIAGTSGPRIRKPFGTSAAPETTRPPLRAEFGLGHLRSSPWLRDTRRVKGRPSSDRRGHVEVALIHARKLGSGGYDPRFIAAKRGKTETKTDGRRSGRDRANTSEGSEHGPLPPGDSRGHRAALSSQAYRGRSAQR